MFIKTQVVLLKKCQLLITNGVDMLIGPGPANRSGREIRKCRFIMRVYLLFLIENDTLLC